MTTLQFLLMYGRLSDWKHAGTRLADHEKSDHQPVLSLARRSVEVDKVDHELRSNETMKLSDSFILAAIQVTTT